jgi:competence ComEA-like helix-hairpin-helix protein
MTPLEGRGLLKGGLLLLALSALRFGVTTVTGNDPILLEGESDLQSLMDASLQEAAEADRRSAPLAAGETLDPNRSGEEELDRLPGIGPATAEALMAYRENHGGFRRAEDLLNVPGIGPATLEKIRPFLDFSSGIPVGGELRYRPGGQRPGPLRSLQSQRAPEGMVSQPPKPSRVDLNRADAKELETLPGIGPALAQRIVEYRQRSGYFRVPGDLLRVRGIGPAKLERIRDLIVPRG